MSRVFGGRGVLPMNGGSSEGSGGGAGGEAALLTLDAGDCPARRPAAASLLSDFDVVPAVDVDHLLATAGPVADELPPLDAVPVEALGGGRTELGVAGLPAVP